MVYWMRPDQRNHPSYVVSFKQSRLSNDISNSDLIQHCLNGSRPAWEIFFRRYNKLIDRRIIKTLEAFYINYNVDMVGKISLGIIEKLYNERILTQVEDCNKLQSWLGKVVKNHTLDWLRSRGRIGNSFNIMMERETVSLSQPLDGQGGLVIEDIIYDEAPDQGDLASEVNGIFDEIDKLSDKYRLTLKVAIMLYDSLSDETIQEIAQLQGIPVANVTEKVDIITNDLLRRNLKALRNRNRAFILWAFTKRLKARLNFQERNPGQNRAQIADLKREIEKKSVRRKDLLSRFQRLIRPTSRQIADLLGISEANATTVNVLLHRARKMLKEQKNK